MKERYYLSLFSALGPSLMGLAFFYSGFFVFLTPVVYAYAFTRRGGKSLASHVCASSLIVFFIAFFLMPKFYLFYTTSPHWAWLFPIPAMNLFPIVGHFWATLFSLGYFLIMACFALVTGYSLQIKSLFYYLVRLGLLGLLILSTFVLIYVNMKDVSISSVLTDYYSSSLGEFLTLQEQAGLPADQLEYLKEYTPNLVKLMSLLTPSFAFISIIGILLLNIILLRRLFAMMKILPLRSLLSDWHVPFSGVWVVISALTIVVGWINGFAVPYLMPVVLNILFILGFLYYIQGLGIILYYFDKKEVSFLVKVFFYSFILLLFQVSTLALVATGFFDSWFDFRKMAKK